MTPGETAQPRILHILSRFAEGDASRRCQAAASAIGEGAIHDLTVVGEAGAAPAPFRQARGFPQVTGLPTLGRLQRIARAMLGYDLVCTYDYGAMNAAMAHTAFSRAFELPPLIHHENEGARRSTKADWYRRVALAKASCLVVPDERLEEAALASWQQPMGRVKIVREGIDLAQWRDTPPPDILPALLKRPGEKWVGLVTRFAPEERLEQVLPAIAQLSGNWHLVILGEGPGRSIVRKQAESLQITHRVHFPGPADQAARAIGLFDVALCQPSAPDSGLTAIRAMASGNAILADTSSSAASLLPEANAEFCIDFRDGDELAIALAMLSTDEFLRNSAGKANRQQAESHHDAKAMVQSLRGLYASAIGRNFDA